ncbi:MAG: TonB-dependent receptor plug domain-containing protein [Raineya sp.]|jgi:iron complex outermembrane receptor protein|nr:TonB-dependent receptor plug domain-containing protein [Raineya sp.]
MRYLLLVCWLITNALFAQDSISAIEVKAYPYKKYAIGAKTWQADSVLIAQNNSSQLSEWLLRYTGAYMKEYGNGLLGSISLRGTGAGHTAVLWNGLNINSATLGESDFVNIPLFANDQVGLQMGSSASLFGSEAVGGAILLSGMPQKSVNGQKIHFRQDIGSFGRNFTALKFYHHQEKISIRASIYRFSLKNDFNIPSLSGTIQNTTPINYLGATQDIQYQISKKQQINFHSWYNSNYRILAGNNNLLDNNLRLMTSWKNDLSTNTSLETKIAYTNDFLLYNNQERTQTKRLAGIFQLEHFFSEKLSTQIGVNTQYFMMSVDAYKEPKTELRTDAFLMNRWQVLPSWVISLNIRQSFVKGYQAPFTPSLGTEWIIFDKSNRQITWKAQIGRGYRLPTLNSRYWQPGGNPNIQPEQSLSSETSMAYEQKNNYQSFKIEATAFMMQVKDWIIWQPTLQGFWSPENLQNVDSKGLEAHIYYTKKWKKGSFSLFTNYAFTLSQIQKIKNDVSNRFTSHYLPYTPVNRISVGINSSIQNTQISLNSHFTDKRFTDLDNINIVKAFWLTDFQVQQKIKYKVHTLQIGGQINNIFNKQYQNVLNQYMPERNYQISLQYFFQ